MRWQRRAGIQLAYPYSEKRVQKWGSIAIVQPKLDGLRCRAIIQEDGSPLLVSSEENIITSMPHITSAIAALDLFPGAELDGELYIHTVPRQLLSSLVSRKGAAPDSHLIEYHIFDLVTDGEQWKRLSVLADLSGSFSLDGPLKRVPYHLATGGEVEELLSFYYNQSYEGIILRNPAAHYQRKRTTDMLKWKPRKADCYLIVGAQEELSKDGEPKNALGALLLTTPGEEPFRVGSGPFLTRSEREHLWAIREHLPGKWATVRYQELTLRGVPSHPVLFNITDLPVDLGEGEEL